MTTCPDCGGPAARGWTVPSDHLVCCPCAIARALGSPIPPRRTEDGLTYWQRYYQRRKLRQWKEARDA